MRPWTAVDVHRDSADRQQLQWGHGLAAVDGRDLAVVFPTLMRLQWGHGLAAVDGAA